ncbi:MAG: 50S ribosomal protein L6 [Patescibacteria group bacterium]
MSRIAKKPIVIPSGVTVTVKPEGLTVKGPKGTLTKVMHRYVVITPGKDEAGKDTLAVGVTQTTDKFARAMWGTAASHLKNMIKGVTEGFSKELKISGVGYTWTLEGQKLTMKLGFSHPVTVTLPQGVAGKVAKNSLVLESIDKELLGQTAANIRSLKKPEPYKGKGIAYSDEHVRRKAGKQAKAAGA